MDSMEGMEIPHSQSSPSYAVGLGEYFENQENQENPIAGRRGQIVSASSAAGTSTCRLSLNLRYRGHVSFSVSLHHRDGSWEGGYSGRCDSAFLPRFHPGP